MNKQTFQILTLTPVFDLVFDKFLANDYPTIMTVCKAMCRLLKQNMQAQTQLILLALRQQYSKYLDVHNSTVRYTRSKATGSRGSSLDIEVCIQLRILRTLDINHSYSINYSYSHQGKQVGRGNTLCWQTQFNLLSDLRQAWIYKEETRNHYAKQNISLIQDVLPARVGDVLVLRIPYLTRFGFTQVNSLKFYKLKQQPLVRSQCVIQRHFQWTLYKYFQHPIQFQIEDIIRMYPEHLQVMEIRCAGVDCVNFKIKLKCVKEGTLDQLLDHSLQIKGRDQTVKLVLKKRGCYDGAKSKLQLRVGDQLVIYHTPNY